MCAYADYGAISSRSSIHGSIVNASYMQQLEATFAQPSRPIHIVRVSVAGRWYQDHSVCELPTDTRLSMPVALTMSFQMGALGVRCAGA